MKVLKIIIPGLIALFILSGCNKSDNTTVDIVDVLYVTERMVNITVEFNSPIELEGIKAELINEDGNVVSSYDRLEVNGTKAEINFLLDEGEPDYVDGNYYVKLSEAFPTPISSNKKELVFEYAWEDETNPEISEEENEIEVEEEVVVEEELEVEEKNYQQVTYNHIQQNYDDLLFGYIEIQGSVLQVMEGEEAPYAGISSYLVTVDNGDLVWIDIFDSTDKPTLTNGSHVTIQGSLEEPETYETVNNSTNTVPAILAHQIILN